MNLPHRTCAGRQFLNYKFLIKLQGISSEYHFSSKVCKKDMDMMTLMHIYTLKLFDVIPDGAPFHGINYMLEPFRN